MRAVDEDHLHRAVLQAVGGAGTGPAALAVPHQRQAAAVRKQQVNGEEESIRLTAEVAPQSIVAGMVRSEKLMNLNVVIAETIWDVAVPAKKRDARKRTESMP